MIEKLKITFLLTEGKVFYTEAKVFNNYRHAANIWSLMAFFIQFFTIKFRVKNKKRRLQTSYRR